MYECAEIGCSNRVAHPGQKCCVCEQGEAGDGYDRIERVSQVREFFETDWENAEQLTDFFDG